MTQPLIIGADGKTGITSSDKTAIRIEILHKQAGNSPTQKIPVLMGELDPNITEAMVKNVLSAAMTQIVKHLYDLEVLRRPNQPSKRLIIP